MFPTLQTLLRIGIIFSVSDRSTISSRIIAASRARHRPAAERLQGSKSSPGRRDPSFHFESLTFPVGRAEMPGYFATFHPWRWRRRQPARSTPASKSSRALRRAWRATVEATEHVLEMGERECLFRRVGIARLSPRRPDGTCLRPWCSRSTEVADAADPSITDT